MNDRGMVIAGAGECGTRAAFALREEGYTGPVTLIGAERHLPYERPPLSKEGMAETGVGMKVIADAERLQAAGIRLMPSTQVVAIDRAAQLVELSVGDSLPYEKLLLATGAQPRRLPLAENSRHCAYLRTHDDAETIAECLRPQARIVIIGGGFIGLELAAAARQRGCAVTVLEMLPRLLARAVPAEIAIVIETAHRSHGVDIRCGVSLSEIKDTEGGVSLTLGDRSRVEAALCIVGIGAIPNTELAQRAGLAVENGIRVDDRLRTDDPAIFAAGDCCAFPLALYSGRRVRLEAWRNAQDQGTLAALNMLGKDEAHAVVPWFWSDQYHLTLQVAGLADEGTEVVRRHLGGGAFILFHLDASGRLVAASGIGPGNAVARDVRLAELLIARRATLPRDKLAAADVKLKTLIAALRNLP